MIGSSIPRSVCSVIVKWYRSLPGRSSARRCTARQSVAPAATPDEDPHPRRRRFGAQRDQRGSLRVTGVLPPVVLPADDPRHAKLLATLLQDLVMTGQLADC